MVEEPYDPERARDEVRTRVTFFLLWVLTGVVAATLLSLWILWLRGAEVAAQTSSLKDLAAIILNPIVALLGTAIGFYFGTQRLRRGA